MAAIAGAPHGIKISRIGLWLEHNWRQCGSPLTQYPNMNVLNILRVRIVKRCTTGLTHRVLLKTQRCRFMERVSRGFPILKPTVPSGIFARGTSPQET
jgi:hypothetical protein